MNKSSLAIQGLVHGGTMRFFDRIFKKKELDIFYTEEVFKTNGVPEYTFVKRDNIENKINSSVRLKNKLLLFLGYSKSGKTVYRKTYFAKHNIKPILYRCNKHSTWVDLYKTICTEANIPFKSSVSNGSNSSQTLVGSVKATAKVVESEFSSEISEQQTQEQTRTYPLLDIDVNHICNNLSDNDLIIILEDYHLVSDDFAQKLSEDLKHFLDDEILFLLIGIPSSPGRSLKNNPDLGGRIQSINFDYLHEEEIDDLLNKGEEKLNITIKKDVRRKIKEYSYQNAFLVQAIAQKILLMKSINKTSSDKTVISDKADVDKACKELAKELFNDFRDITDVIISGQRKQKETKFFNQYEEILKTIKTTNIDTLESGIQLGDIVRNTWNDVPEEIKDKVIENGTYQNRTTLKNSISSSISIALKKIEENLENSNSRKILIFIDNKLYLMDLVFKFYLNWKDDILRDSYELP
jgi:hypothetical protein